MSILPPDVHQELDQLLVALQSPDNTVRSQAEEHLQNSWTNTRPEVLLMGLAEQIQASQENTVSETSTPHLRTLLPTAADGPTQTRTFAAVIFRRIASRSRKNEAGNNVDMFLSLADEQANVIRHKLLETLGAETDRAVRNKISYAVAEIARQYTDNGRLLLRRFAQLGTLNLVSSDWLVLDDDR
jgi:importin-5